MIVDDLDIMHIFSIPTKTNAPLVVDSDAMLSLTISRQCFQPISRKDPQVAQFTDLIELNELSVCDAFDVYESVNAGALRKPCGILTIERTDHRSIV